MADAAPARRMSTLDLPTERPLARGINRLVKRAMTALLEDGPLPERFDRSIYLFHSDGRRVGAASANHMKVRDDGHLARAAGIRGDSDAPTMDFDPATDLSPDERAAIRAANEMCASDAAEQLGITVRQLRRRIEAGNRRLRAAAEAALSR